MGQDFRGRGTERNLFRRIFSAAHSDSRRGDRRCAFERIFPRACLINIIHLSCASGRLEEEEDFQEQTPGGCKRDSETWNLERRG